MTTTPAKYQPEFLSQIKKDIAIDCLQGRAEKNHYSEIIKIWKARGFHASRNGLPVVRRRDRFARILLYAFLRDKPAPEIKRFKEIGEARSIAEIAVYLYPDVPWNGGASDISARMTTWLKYGYSSDLSKHIVDTDTELRYLKITIAEDERKIACIKQVLSDCKNDETMTEYQNIMLDRAISSHAAFLECSERYESRLSRLLDVASGKIDRKLVKSFQYGRDPLPTWVAQFDYANEPVDLFINDSSRKIEDGELVVLCSLFDKTVVRRFHPDSFNLKLTKANPKVYLKSFRFKVDMFPAWMDMFYLKNLSNTNFVFLDSEGKRQVAQTSDVVFIEDGELKTLAKIEFDTRYISTTE